jgi:hypothetical protein
VAGSKRLKLAGANDSEGSCPTRTGSAPGSSARPQRGVVRATDSSRRMTAK